jgi:hypothetical protein
MAAPRPGHRTLAVASWAVGGVAALLLEGIVRLGAFALAGLRQGLGPLQWAGLVSCTLVLGYLEGYRGFQRSFSPRVVERAFALASNASPLAIALAPLHAMGLLGGPRRERMRSWLLLVAIAVVILVVRRLPMSWRSIVDAAVASSLTWGLVTMALRFVQRVRRHGGSVDAG